MMFSVLGDGLEFLFALGLIYAGGILMAQTLKLLPLFLAMSEVMKFHRTFPLQDYLKLRTLLKMAPYRLLTSSVDYTIALVTNSAIDSLRIKQSAEKPLLCAKNQLSADC